jgi:AAA15 family ATPase/GTPase
MVADKARQHGERVPRLPKYHLRVLPVAAIFGANSSGKTNLFMAFNFVKRFVVEGTTLDNPIDVEPYQLSPESLQNPTRFQFQLLCGDDIYDFSFTVTHRAVLEEKLVRILSRTEHEIYHSHDGICDFPSVNSKDKKDYAYAFTKTKVNQLFLTTSIMLLMDFGRPVFDWFNNNLTLIAPDARFGAFERFYDVDHPQYDEMIALIKGLDVGVSEILTNEIPIQNLPCPPGFLQFIKNSIKDNETVRFYPGPTKERYLVTKRGGGLIAKTLTTMHNDENDNPIKFTLSREPDGTIRMIDLLPAFVNLMDSSSKYVFLIDELDRSLHPALTRALLSEYLGQCDKETRTQLLFTTQDAFHMDQRFFRREEMWLVDRIHPGASTLYSLIDFADLGYDKNLNKRYLSGRFGGVPDIFISKALNL